MRQAHFTFINLTTHKESLSGVHIELPLIPKIHFVYF